MSAPELRYLGGQDNTSVPQLQSEMQTPIKQQTKKKKKKTSKKKKAKTATKASEDTDGDWTPTNDPAVAAYDGDASLFENMRVPELRAMLKTHGIKVSGVKAGRWCECSGRWHYCFRCSETHSPLNAKNDY